MNFLLHLFSFSCITFQQTDNTLEDKYHERQVPRFWSQITAHRSQIHHSLDVWSWVSHQTSLSFNFLICEVRIGVIMPTWECSVMHVKESESRSVMSDSSTMWTIQSIESSRPEYWSGQPFPSPGDLPNPGTEPRVPTLQADSLPSEPPGKPKNTGVGSLSLLQGIFPTQEWNRGLLHCVKCVVKHSAQHVVSTC